MAEELHKPIIKQFKKEVYSSFKNNFEGVDLADVQLISKFTKRTTLQLYVIDIFSNYAWVVF